ncbi:amidohydrolase family protein [Natronorubrum sp. FCH18a]|uniref:amidohydrolase family protein n=1 Tax=Natronorubrum sp. FCH18a TaxID=3447018 RepID=UPI003F5181CF
MYEGVLVGDGVLHAYNNTRENAVNETGFNVAQFIQAFTAHHTVPDDSKLPEKEWYRNFSAEEIAKVSFLESDVDFGVYHATPIFDYFKDGYSSVESGIEMRDENPERVKVLGAVNPLDPNALEEVDRQVEELGVDGFKLYPTFYKPGGRVQELRADGDWLPIIERAVDVHGIDHIGFHKSFPLGPTGLDHQDPGDVADIASQFPNVDFELLHTGYVPYFTKQAVMMTGNYDNIYLTFEGTMNQMHLNPGRFVDIIGNLLNFGNPERLIFASGVPAFHQQYLIEMFMDFQIPEEARAKHNYPKLTDDIKKKILSENLIDLYDWDKDALLDAVENDKWAKRREEVGQPAPWSSIENIAQPADD